MILPLIKINITNSRCHILNNIKTIAVKKFSEASVIVMP